MPRSKPLENDADIQEKLDKEILRKELLQGDVQKTEKELDKIKKKLVTASGKIQKNEISLKELEQRIASLEVKKSILEDKLKADRSSIAKLILALTKLRMVPPEVLFARPESPHETAQSAMLIRDILPSFERHAQGVNKNLETLDRVTKELISEREELLAESTKLKKKREDLSVLMEKRKTLYAYINKDLKARNVIIQKLSLQAKNLQDLIQKSKEEETQRRKAQAHQKRKPHQKRNKKITEFGSARLPVSGIIRVAYNQKDEHGTKSKGLKIEGRSGSLVVSPMNGRIQFSGPFKRYGNIIIIEHSDGFHSLIAGLERIDGMVGDFVKSGEPLGSLPDSTLIPRPTLYYELRQRGVLVDPALKFPNLG